MTTRLVFLVPGFFGFSSVGAVSYFEDVERALGAALLRRGLKAQIVRCPTQPTASITRRADALRRHVQRCAARSRWPRRIAARRWRTTSCPSRGRRCCWC